MRSKSSLWTVVLTLVAMAASAAAQGTRAGPDVPREQMWPAPTAEDWAKPVLIKWE